MQRKNFNLEEIKQNDSKDSKISTFTAEQRESFHQVHNYLSEADLATEDNLNLIIQNIFYIHALKWDMHVLKKSGLLTRENVTIFLNKFFFQEEHYDVFNRCLLFLCKHNLLIQENYNLLIQQEGNLGQIFCGLSQLKDREILTQTNFNLIMQKPKHADALSRSISCLSKKSFITDEMINLLISEAKYADHLAVGFEVLKENKALDTKDNYMALLKHAKHVCALPWILSINATQQNFDMVFLYRDFLQNIIDALLEYPRKNLSVTQAVLDSTILNINKQMIEERTAFLMGEHPRLGEKSSLRIFFKSPLCDKKNITNEILDFLPRPRKLQKL